ncbi:MAG: hypothetical protein N3C12_14960 [Candidatus Binatia bacterium]|nr:hypothetical protein [Candidatus Binatia bacterium]
MQKWAEQGAAEPPVVAAEVLPFRRVTSSADEKYRTCVPLLTLKAAAGAFGEPQAVASEEWVAPDSRRWLQPGMFVAQLVDRPMEPRIPDGAWCLFRAPVEGSRQGKIALV